MRNTVASMASMKAIVPDSTQMRRYLDQGLSQRQIADAYEKDTGIKVSRSAIGMAIGRYGLKSSRPAERYMDMLPWDIAAEHQYLPEARLLRFEARRRRGLELADREMTWLGNWLTMLEEKNAVVTYDPRTKEGFWLVPRTPEDGADIIRRPK